MTLGLLALLAVRTLTLPADPVRSPVTIEAPRGYATTVLLPTAIASARCNGGHAFGLTVAQYRPEGRLVVKPTGHAAALICRLYDAKGPGATPIMTLHLAVGGPPGDSEVRLVLPRADDLGTVSRGAEPVALRRPTTVAHSGAAAPAVHHAEGRLPLAPHEAVATGGAPKADNPASPPPAESAETAAVAPNARPEPVRRTLPLPDSAPDAGADADSPGLVIPALEAPADSAAPPASLRAGGDAVQAGTPPSSTAVTPELSTAAPTPDLEALSLAEPVAIGRTEGLPGQHPCTLTYAYRPKLKSEARLWLKFALDQGAGDHLATVSTAWGEPAAVLARQVGVDLELIVEVPCPAAKDKKSWLELEFAKGGKYRFTSLDSPSLKNSLKTMLGIR